MSRVVLEAGASERNGRLVTIMGPNACGKSNLGVAIARRLDGEVVSADSRQVFRGLDLGTGKLSFADRGDVAHHLIDVVEPGEVFSLAQYQEHAYRAIDNILARRRVPVLVGGSGLYLRSIIDGYELVDVPEDPALRRELARLNTEDLVRWLSDLDRERIRSIDLENRRRLIRAIEVAKAGTAFEATRQQNPRYTVLKLGLTWPDEVLRERIRRRLQYRIDQGMIEEVVGLIDRGVDEAWLHRLGLEYRHILRFVKGAYASVEELTEKLATGIWQFARRQRTWFRREPDIVWLDTNRDFEEEAGARAVAFLDQQFDDIRTWRPS